MDSGRLVRRASLASAVCGALLSLAGPLQAVTFSEFVDPHPAPGNQFGAAVVALSTGNVVITSPFDDAGGTNAGAVYLFNGATGALISTLRGSTANDDVGLFGVTALTNGNYVVQSPAWHNGGVFSAGAVTWGSGTTGVSGVVSAANSLVGTTASDRVGESGVTVLTNGNYVVASAFWDNGAIADAGAVTWGSGTTGVSGVVSAVNSLVGSSASDRVGYDGVTALTNGNYVVASSIWNNGAIADAGAATWGNGTTGVSGVLSAANSLVGSKANDQVGSPDVAVRALTNGNYVVRSSLWDNGATVDAGAVTWGSGTAGVSGVISPANSLVGSTASDQVGSSGVTALTNGSYVVLSEFWDNGAIADAGAATWESGTAGVTGVVSAANSLVGSTANDNVSNGGVTALTNGNYVVRSSFWDKGATVDAGAATWGSGTAGVSGVVSAGNSLVGSTASDEVGGSGVAALTNGNYVVSSWLWDNGAAADAGAVTWGSGTTGVSGVVSAANSLVGSTAGDQVGSLNLGVTALTNGNYVVPSPNWDRGATVDVGAVTWGSGTTGVSGLVSAANSLVGSTANDNVSSGGVTALTNGNYVVASQSWDNPPFFNAGAAICLTGANGVSGVVSATNSLVGTTDNTDLRRIVVDDVNGTYFARFVAEGSGRVRVSSQLDHLAPATPTQLTGAYSGGQTSLQWAANTENDLDGYRVYRGAAADFTPTVGNRIATPTSTNYVDVGPEGSYYKLSAVDVNGNESGFALLTPAQTTGVEADVPVAFALEGALTNPARGHGLNVAFELPSGAPARLDLLDVGGRRVLSRAVGMLGAGWHTVDLAEGRKVAPGIYWVRLAQGANQGTKQVAVIE